MCSPGKESMVNEHDETGFPICEYGSVHLCGLKRGRPKQAYFLQGRLLDLKWTWSIMCCCCYSGWAAAAAGCVYMWLNVHYCSHFSLYSSLKHAIIHEIEHHYHPRSQAIFFLLFKNKKNLCFLLPSHKGFDLKCLFIDRFSPGRYAEWQIHGENGADVSATSKLSCVRNQWLWADNKSCMCWYISLKLIFVSQRLCGKVLFCKERWI